MASSGQSSSGGSGQTVDLSALTAPQLSQIKKQLDDELSHLNDSFLHLRAAQSKFRDCIKSVTDGLKSSPSDQQTQEQKQILVPLTSSLYVPGTLASTTHVLVDVGTGFYVEKTLEAAIKFYEGKVSELAASLKELEKVLGAKSQNLRVVEDVLRQKVLSGGAGSGASVEGEGAAAATAAAAG